MVSDDKLPTYIFTESSFLRTGVSIQLLVVGDGIRTIGGQDSTPPPMVIEAKRLAAIHSDFVIAAAAIHRSAISGLKGYLGLDAAFSTYGSKHLAIRRSGTAKSA